MWLTAILLLGLLGVGVVRPSILFGFTSKDGVTLSSSTAYSRNGLVLKGRFPWLRKVDENTVIGLYGDVSDCEYLMEKVLSTCQLHAFSFPSLSTTEIASFCRHLIVKNLRKRPLQVSLMVAGRCSQQSRPVLFWLDEIGSMKETQYCAHGVELPFLLSLLDRQNCLWREKNGAGFTGLVTDEDVNTAVKLCWESIRHRSAVDYSEVDTVFIRGKPSSSN